MIKSFSSWQYTYWHGQELHLPRWRLDRCRRLVEYSSLKRLLPSVAKSASYVELGAIISADRQNSLQFFYTNKWTFSETKSCSCVAIERGVQVKTPSIFSRDIIYFRLKKPRRCILSGPSWFVMSRDYCHGTATGMSHQFIQSSTCTDRCVWSVIRIKRNLMPWLNRSPRCANRYIAAWPTTCMYTAWVVNRLREVQQVDLHLLQCNVYTRDVYFGYCSMQPVAHWCCTCVWSVTSALRYDVCYDKEEDKLNWKLKFGLISAPSNCS